MKLKRRVPAILGWLMALVGIFNVVANILRPFKGAAHRIDSYTIVYVNSTAFTTSLISGIFLIILSTGIRKRKERAWNLSVIILALGISAEAFRYRAHYEHISINLIALITLVIFRDQFYAKSDPATRRRPLLALVIAAGVSISTGFLLLLFRHSKAIVGDPSLVDLFRTVVNGLVGLPGPVTFTEHRISETVHGTLLLFGIATLSIPIQQYFKKITPINQIDFLEAEKIKEIVLNNPQSDSLSYFSTRLDKSIIWSDSHTAGQSYRVQNGVLLASGDPFGHYSLWSEVIDKAIEISEEYAWTLAVMGCSERAGELWIKKSGMEALHIGDEAVIISKNFSTTGSNMKNVREMINKTKRLGYSVDIRKATELNSELISLLEVKAIEWRYGQRERGFSMALDRLISPIDDQLLFAIAYKDNLPMAMMSFSPWAKSGISLDKMLRDKNADTGINELIISEVIEYSRNNDIQKISLNFAAFRAIFEEAERISAGPILRIKRDILRFFSKWVQVESLYRFNVKFQPEWHPRYLIYPGPTKLFEIAIAVGKVEGFI